MKLEDIESLLQENIYYFFAPFGMGDVYMLYMIKDTLQNTLNSKIIFVLQEKDIAIAELFGDTEFIAIQNDSFRTNENLFLNLPICAKKPTKGKIFPAHACFILTEYKIQASYLLGIYEIFFKLPKNYHPTIPKNPPKLTPELKIKLEQIAPLEKIVFYLPESVSLECLPQYIFIRDMELLQKEGYKIIINATKQSYNYEGTYNLNLSLRDAIAVALNVGRVIAIRSGFCDLIGHNVKNLRVYYPSGSLKFNSLLANKISHNVEEIVFCSSSIADKHLPYKIGELLLAYQYRRISFLKCSRRIYRAHKQSLNTQPTDYPTDLIESTSYQLGLAFINNNGNLARYWYFGFILRFCTTKNHKFFIRKQQSPPPPPPERRKR
ncbi:hypothetical protein ACRE1U_04075 [Helicobacter himalayensis]|uniref:hypothetical protein n=1 Tax=Helicobacter himalayensis TaxID=1591088 RepID=UPI003D6FE84A